MLLAGCLYLLATPAATGRVPTPPRAIPPESFVRIGNAIGTPGAPQSTPVPTLAVLGPTRAPVAVPTPGLVAEKDPEPGVMPNHRLTGRASWYCKAGVSVCHYKYPDGMYAAAGPRLRQALGPGWRGKIVETCLQNDPDRCVRVKIVDWCQCSKGKPTEKIIDLYSTPFSRLAPLSRGVVAVTIHW